MVGVRRGRERVKDWRIAWFGGQVLGGVLVLALDLDLDVDCTY